MRVSIEQIIGATVLGGVAFFLYRKFFPAAPESTQELPPGESGSEFSYVQASYAPVSTEDFFYSLPLAASPYADVIAQVASETGVDPYLITAIGMRESGWGGALRPPNPAGRGDSGHGHGIMQIDDRTWGSWLASNPWQDPLTNVRKGVSIYLANRSYFAKKGLVSPILEQAALAGYNRGWGKVWDDYLRGDSPDKSTAGGDYGGTVLAMASVYATGAA